MPISVPSIFQNAKSHKKRYILGAIITVILITLCAIGFNQYQSKNFNLNITEAEKNYKMEKFVEAREYYKTALTYKADNDVQSKIQLCYSMQLSLDQFNKGTDLLSKKDYLGAINTFKEVIPQDEKRFNLAKDKIAESSKLYIADRFIQANDFMKNNSPDFALKQIDLVLAIDSNNETAKTLKVQYQSALDVKIAEDKAKADADAKAKELADTKAREKAEADAKALAKTQGVRIGMTQQQVLDSSWGRPNDINKTTSKYGTHEQWVYGGRNYLYFENGILTDIQN